MEKCVLLRERMKSKGYMPDFISSRCSAVHIAKQTIILRCMTGRHSRDPGRAMKGTTLSRAIVDAAPYKESIIGSCWE